MLTEIVVFFAFLIESCTGGVLQNLPYGRGEQADEEQALLQQPVSDGNLLRDFTDFDEDDAIFQEFEARGENTWRESRRSLRDSCWLCFKTVLQIQAVAGLGLGLLAVVLALLDFNTADLCYERTFMWDTIPPIIQSIRVTGQAIEGFVIELWDFLLMLIVFGWKIMKDLNLLTLNLLAAFTDMTYRLYFQVYGIYKLSWMSFPLNALFTVMIIVNSYLIARHLSPGSRGNSFKVAYYLSAQFVLGMSVNLILVYKIIPWYNSQSNEYFKVIIAGTSPLITAIPKMLSRIGAQNLEGIAHPGIAYALVGVLYGATSITFRVMQAELNSFDLFVALGFAHATVDLVERITITMRDQIWEYLYKIIARFAKCQGGLPALKLQTPRSKRFIADVSLQIMLLESTGLITAVGYIQVYSFMYSDHSWTDYRLILGFLARSSAGLIIDIFFNTVSVMLQTRYMNVAINRVWKKKWRTHIVVATLIACITTLYYTEYLFGVVRGKWDKTAHKWVRFDRNCSLPFTNFS